MKYKVFFFLIIVFLSSKQSPAYAQNFSLSVNPSVITIQTKAPKLITKSIYITNNATTPLSLKLRMQPFTQADTNHGVVSYGVNKEEFLRKDPKIFEKIKVYDANTLADTITIAPKQKKELTLRITLPERQRNGDYYFSILFASNSSPVIVSETKQSLEDRHVASNATEVATAPRDDKNGSDGIQAQSTTVPAIATNVLLSIYTGKKTPEGIIDQYSAPLFVSAGPVPFTLVFKNTRSHLLIPQGTIFIKNMFGQVIGKISIPKTHVLANTVRILSAVWKEEFLLGPYTAELHLAFSDNKSASFTRSISFFAFPSGQLVSIIGGIIVLLLIKTRLNKYRREHI